MARYPIKMLLDKDLGPFIPYLPSNAVVVEGSNKTVADQITDLHNEINERLSTVYDFKGSVTFENLPTTGQKTGDVYDITNDFILNDQEYPAGTNLAWATDHWDPLAGLLNVKTVYKKLDLSVAMMATVSSISGYAFTIEANKAEWLKLINDTVKAGEQYVDFVTTKDDGYTFRLYILSTTDGIQNCNMMIYAPLYKLYNLHYADTYWYSKTVKITFADGIATDITVQTGSGYSYREWLYPQFRNTTAFTPTAATHLVTKGYVDDADALKEALANKITTLLSTSTDTEYPSAKAVYDFVKNNINMGKLTIPNNQNDAVTFQNLKPGLYMFAETLYALDYYYYFRYKTADNPIYLGRGVVPILLIVYKDPNTIAVPATGTSEEFALVYTWSNSRAGDDTSGYIGVKRFALRHDNQSEVILDMNGNPITYGRTIDNNSQEITGIKTFAAIPKQKNTTAPTLDEQFTNKKYVDDAIKGTDLSQYVELSQTDPDVILRNVRYANIGDSFSLTYIVGTTANKSGIAFYVKIPVSHYYKTTPSAYTYEPMGTVTYFEYDSQTQIATPKNAYGYLTYNPSDPDHVEIKIYPLDYSSQIGILANSYFYVNCNWIRI